MLVLHAGLWCKLRQATDGSVNLFLLCRSAFAGRAFAVSSFDQQAVRVVAAVAMEHRWHNLEENPSQGNIVSYSCMLACHSRSSSRHPRWRQDSRVYLYVLIFCQAVPVKVDGLVYHSGLCVALLRHQVHKHRHPFCGSELALRLRSTSSPTLLTWTAENVRLAITQRLQPVWKRLGPFCEQRAIAFYMRHVIIVTISGAAGFGFFSRTVGLPVKTRWRTWKLRGP